MASGHDHEQNVLAERVRTLVDLVADGSPVGMARILNGLDPADTASRGTERARDIETDRRVIQRWLAGDSLMTRQSRQRLLRAANTRLEALAREPLPTDYLDVDEPDPLEEISAKLDLLLAHFRIEPARGATESELALQRLEQQPNGRSGPAARRSRGGAK